MTFRRGQRVKLTPEGIAHLGGEYNRFKRIPYDEKLRGTVVTDRVFSNPSVCVLKDGYLTPHYYALNFWEPE